MFYNVISQSYGLCVTKASSYNKKTTFYIWGVADVCFHQRFNYEIAVGLVDQMHQYAVEKNLPDDAVEWDASVILCVSPHKDNYIEDNKYYLPSVDLISGEPEPVDTGNHRFIHTYDDFITTPVTTTTPQYETYPTTTTNQQWFNTGNVTGGIYPTVTIDYA